MSIIYLLTSWIPGGKIYKISDQEIKEEFKNTPEDTEYLPDKDLKRGMTVDRAEK